MPPFLQPYLGDAARYFEIRRRMSQVRRAIRKEAIDTLERLHTCGLYDRIIIVAHRSVVTIFSSFFHS